MNRQTNQVYNEWLVLRCQGGDHDAIAEMVSHWHPQLLRFAVVVIRDRDLAEEAVQEAWISIIRGLPKLRTPETFKTWIFRIAHNKCRDLLRRRPGVQESAEEPTGRVHLNKLEDREQIERTLDALSGAHRVVLALHYLHDIEVAEIAAMLEIPEGTVKSRLYHAREAFRRILQGEDQHEPAGSGHTPGAVANG